MSAAEIIFRNPPHAPRCRAAVYHASHQESRCCARFRAHAVRSRCGREAATWSDDAVRVRRRRDRRRPDGGCDVVGVVMRARGKGRSVGEWAVPIESTCSPSMSGSWRRPSGNSSSDRDREEPTHFRAMHAHERAAEIHDAMADLYPHD